MIIKSILYLSSILSLLALPFITKAQIKNDIRAAQLTNKLPALDKDGKIIFTRTDTTGIYVFQNLVMYHLNYNYQRSKFDDAGNDILLQLEKKFFWLVYEKSNPLGYMFFDDSIKVNQWGAVDSVLINNGVSHIQLYQAFKTDVFQKLRSDIQTGTGNLHETYVTNSGKYTGDTIYCTFTNSMKDIPFSFDIQLDSAKQMKLCKVRIISGEAYQEEYKVTLPAREAVLELKAIPINNEREIMSYFNRFMKLEKH